MKFLAWLIFVAVGLLTVLLAVANRGPVTFSLDPLPLALELPLYAVILASVFIGLLIGAGAMWLRDGKVRRLARQRRREAAKLEDELRAMRDQPALPAGAGRSGATG
ncbi:MAG: lipopolysaccharide assembly protein LapA domain-containing protein [Minwuiales bacterium]|nr:lipopolysaccharide assembly protein LapA domain-containing protein [Minwuiales bacterium]